MPTIRKAHWANRRFKRGDRVQLSYAGLRAQLFEKQAGHPICGTVIGFGMNGFYVRVKVDGQQLAKYSYAAQSYNPDFWVKSQ